MSLGIEPHLSFIRTFALALGAVLVVSLIVAHKIGGASRQKRKTVFFFASLVGLVAIAVYISFAVPAIA